MTSVVFYELPVADVRPGMWTDDGQEILEVRAGGEPATVLYEVYTPRPDDPGVDEENMTAPEVRVVDARHHLRLMWCQDTPVDGSRFVNARNIRYP